MSTLTFNGTSDLIRFKTLSSALGAVSNGAYTIAGIGRKTTAAVIGGVGGFMNSSKNTYYLDEMITAANQLEMADGSGTSHDTTTTWSNTTDWGFFVISRPAGASQTVTLSIADLTTSGAFSHDTGDTVLSDHAGPGTTGFMYIGVVDEVHGADWTGQLGLFAIWNVALTNAQVDALISNKRTSDLWKSSAGTPLVLIELNTLTPVDLGTSCVLDVVTSPLLSGPDPTGWTFDGI